MFILTFTPQLIILIKKHGRLGVNYHGSFDLLSVPANVMKVLLSDQHGLFNWTPILLFSILGLFYLYKIDPKLGSGLSLAFILNLIIVSGWSVWYGAQSFGHRMFVDMTPVFIFGLASLIKKLNEKVGLRYIIAACALFILWNFGLMIQYGSRMIDSAASVPFMERAYNNLFVVPRKFYIIMKNFILARGSFLK